MDATRIKVLKKGLGRFGFFTAGRGNAITVS